MKTVRIITDSAAELTPDVAAGLDISVLPLRYSIGGTIYRQDVDLSSDRLLELLSQGSTHVAALPPATEDVVRIFESVARAGQVAVYIHVANGMIPVLDPILRVTQGLFGRARIEVIDSLAVSYGLQRIVRAAADAAARGAELGDVAQLVRGMVSRIYTLFYAEDFEHLESTVDIQPAQAILASILGVKPLLMLEEGRLIPLEKITPRSTPVDKLADFVFEFATVSEVAVLLGPRPTDIDIEDLRQRILQQYPSLRIPVYHYGPAVAATVGPAAAGLYVYEGLQSGW
ncbi:MAG: DegV family protein [Anaerolineae bacterium]